MVLRRICAKIELTNESTMPVYVVFSSSKLNKETVLSVYARGVGVVARPSIYGKALSQI